MDEHKIPKFTPRYLAAGTWELLPKLPPGEARVDNQPGLEIVLNGANSTDGTKTARRLMVEGQGNDLRLLP